MSGHRRPTSAAGGHCDTREAVLTPPLPSVTRTRGGRNQPAGARRSAPRRPPGRPGRGTDAALLPAATLRPDAGAVLSIWRQHPGVSCAAGSRLRAEGVPDRQGFRSACHGTLPSNSLAGLRAVPDENGPLAGMANLPPSSSECRAKRAHHDRDGVHSSSAGPEFFSDPEINRCHQRPSRRDCRA